MLRIIRVRGTETQAAHFGRGCGLLGLRKAVHDLKIVGVAGTLLLGREQKGAVKVTYLIPFASGNRSLWSRAQPRHGSARS